MFIVLNFSAYSIDTIKSLHWLKKDCSHLIVNFKDGTKRNIDYEPNEGMSSIEVCEIELNCALQKMCFNKDV